MSDPYRDQDAAKLQALLDDERALLVRAGRLMLVAGALTLLSTLLGLPATLASGGVDWVTTGVTAALAALTLQAGVVLSRLPGGSRDYRSIERALGSLRVVYTVKGVIMLAVVGLMALAFLVPTAAAVFL